MTCTQRAILIVTLFTVIAYILIGTGCQTGKAATGTLRGTVTVGPIWPVERPGESRPVPPQVFEARKVVIYNKSKTKILEEVALTQIGRSAKASYSVQLRPGNYVVDINRSGIDSSSQVPKKFEIRPGQTVIVDIDIDTGIR